MNYVVINAMAMNYNRKYKIRLNILNNNIYVYYNSHDIDVYFFITNKSEREKRTLPIQRGSDFTSGIYVRFYGPPRVLNNLPSYICANGQTDDYY